MCSFLFKIQFILITSCIIKIENFDLSTEVISKLWKYITTNLKRLFANIP